MALIGQHQQNSFSNPQNGQAPDADVVRGNDNAVVSKHNAHDADATIHVQTGPLSARPSAGTAGAVYIDDNKRIYVDNGAAWGEVPYARLDAVGTNAFASNVTVGGNLTVTTGMTDVMDVDAADIVADSVTTTAVSTGTLAAAGAVTGASFSGVGTNLTALSAANITTGTLSAARLPTSITATSGVVTPTVQGAATTPRNTLNLGDSATSLLTLTTTSAVRVGASGSGSWTGVNGFTGPDGTITNASAAGYLRVVSGTQTLYIPLLSF